MSTAPQFDFEAVARAALAQARDLLLQWFPAGKFHGREFVIGDLRGARGESLSINIETGKWADFSTDERGGDLISLFAAMNGMKQGDAARHLSDILGGVVSPIIRSAQISPIRTPESVDWDGIFPIPEDAPPPPDVHPHHGKPVHIAQYRDRAGSLIALVYRCEPSVGTKQVVPLTFCRHVPTGRLAWKWQSLPKPRSLYRAELLARAPDAPVLLVEGEPKCDAANAHIADNWIALSWSNGANSWKQADWSLLAGRQIVIWPDADQPGRDAAKHIAEQLPHHKATAKILSPPRGVALGWDIKDAIAEGWETDRLMRFIAPDSKEERALWFSDHIRDEKDIPKRPWLAKGYILRRSVTLIAGAGSIGKSSLFKAWAIAAALGIDFHKFSPIEPYRVLSYNVEDDRDEEDSRNSAVLRQFNRRNTDVDGKLRTIGPNDIGTLIERDPQTGKLKLTEAMLDLICHIEEFLPDIVFLDPLVELHTSEENDNTGLRAVLAQLRALAVRHNIAVVLAHHVRKGTIMPGDPDGIRGAGSIVGAARVTFTLCGMSDEEAQSFAITPLSSKYFFRLDGAKINPAPIQEAEWFERVPYTLDNEEIVAAARPWYPPKDVVTPTVIESVKMVVSKGLDRDAYTIRKGTERWVGVVLKRHGIGTDAGQKQVIDALLADGFAEHSYKRPNRNSAKGLRSGDGEPSSVNWD